MMISIVFIYEDMSSCLCHGPLVESLLVEKPNKCSYLAEVTIQLFFSLSFKPEKEL